MFLLTDGSCGSACLDFADLVRAKEYGDEGSQRRLTEHMRALDTVNEGPGIVPPKGLTEEFAEVAGWTAVASGGGL